MFTIWAVAIPVGDLFVVNLGDLPPWVAAIMAVVVYLEARKARKNAAEAAAKAATGVTKIDAVAVQIDGMLAERDKAKVVEGEQKQKLVSDEKAAALAKGQVEGREATLAITATLHGPLTSDNKQPLPVEDDRTATAAETTAEAAKATAEATGRLADATAEIAGSTQDKK